MVIELGPGQQLGFVLPVSKFSSFREVRRPAWKSLSKRPVPSRLVIPPPSPRNVPGPPPSPIPGPPPSPSNIPGPPPSPRNVPGPPPSPIPGPPLSPPPAFDEPDYSELLDQFKAWAVDAAEDEDYETEGTWLEDNRAEIFKNNLPPHTNTKVVFNIKVASATWDGVEPAMQHSAAGFDPSKIKKTKKGDDYHLKFALNPG